MTDPYRVLITGSRGWPDAAAVRSQLAHYLAFAESCKRGLLVTHGDCPDSPDETADRWARQMQAVGRFVKTDPHPAQNHPTEDFGPWPECGPKRNTFMVGLGHHLCLAFIGPCTSLRCRRKETHASHGASGCARLAEQAGITVRRFIP